MRPDTLAFLERVRHAEDPTPADEERVGRAVFAAVAAGLTSSVAPAPASASSAWGNAPRQTFGKLGVFGSKLNVALVFTAVALGSGDASHRPVTASDVLAPRAASDVRVPEQAHEAIGASPEPAAGAPLEALELPVPPAAEPVKAKAKTKLTEPPAKTTSEPGAPNLRAEIELLERVQAALKRADGLTALRELDAHHTADRSLLAEREAARILALCALQRAHEARVAAREFTRRHPDSVQQEAIATSCANSRRIGPP